MNRDMLIAEAVQKATEDRFYGRVVPSLEEIIASVEAPEPTTEINRQLLDALKTLVKFNTRDWYDGAYSPAEVRIAKAAIAAAEKELK